MAISTCSRSRGLWRGEGGQFTLEPSPTPGPATAGDLDGDGDLDVVVREAAGFEVRHNDGRGGFTAAQSFPAGMVVSGLALGDVDGDGDLDLATAEGLGFSAMFGQSRLFLNDGSGRFVDATATHLPAWSGGMASVRLCDLDADGDLDLLHAAIANPPSVQGLRCFRNRGDGVFADVSQLFPAASGNQLSAQAMPAQFDRDPELEVALLQGRALRLFDRVGSSWQDVTSRLPAAIAAAVRTCSVLDYDEDGDVDLLLATPSARHVFANDGAGTFVDLTATRGEGLSATGIPVDLDGDGDLDLLSGSHILRNMQRQLRLPLPPRVGASMLMDFVAEPGFGTGSHLALAGISPSRLPHPTVTPFGTFFLGQAGSALVAAMLSNAGNTSTATIPVPALPALVGLRIYIQGIELGLPGGNFHFTNCIVTSIE